MNKIQSTAQSLFPQLNIVSLAERPDGNKANLYSGLLSEHNFNGYITDFATISEYKLKGNKLIAALNFPYKGIPNAIVIENILSQYYEEFPHVKTYITYLNKFDVINQRWGEIRSFLSELKAISDKNFQIAFDMDWIKRPEMLSTLFTIISSYQGFEPAITAYLNDEARLAKNILGWAKLSKESSLNNVNYYGPTGNHPPFICQLLNEGFSKIGIIGAQAIDLVKKL